MAIADWRWKTGALAVLGAAGAFLFVLVPAAPVHLATSDWGSAAARTVPGAYHVHTTRSDGHGDRGRIAAAAARAGLKFVILTDHGDATRPPDAPAYLEGVLVLDAVEISTDDGHYVAIDMPRAPYPLGGAGDAVVEDVRRLGGFGIAAHPDSPKAALRWTSAAAPDGIEWLNLDSEWRDEPRTALARAGLAYMLRPAPALALLLDRPVTLDRWNRMAAGRQVVALGAADAHGGAGQRPEEGSRSIAGLVGVPSYEASFRTMSNRVVLEQPLSGEAGTDARRIYDAIRQGSVFTSIDAIAAPAALEFTADSAGGRAGIGGRLPAGSTATLVARALMPAGSELTLVHDGTVIAATRAAELRHVLAGATGAVHVEILAPGASGRPPVPWVVSNPIYLGAAPPEQRADAARQSGESSLTLSEVQAPATAWIWRIERDPSSSGVLRVADSGVALEYKLGDGVRDSQYVALATDIQSQSFRAVDLVLAGDRPLRVSVQLRTTDGARWGRSYYVDPAGSRLRIPVGDLRPIDNASGTLLPASAASLLLVIDLTNAAPGRSGTLRVRSSSLLK